MSDISKGALREKELFEGERLLEIGWGDAGSYQADEITASMVFKALLTPTPSVMHLVGFRDDTRLYLSRSEVKQVTLSQFGFLNMLE